MGNDPEHFRIHELAEGVHAAIATADGFGLCNAGIVDLGNATLVFDSMLTPQAGEALGLAARRLTGRPVDYLVNSHYHGDHVRGNGSVGARHIVSTHRVRELIVERAGAALDSDRAEAPGELEAMRTGRHATAPAERAVFEGWFRGILATPPDHRVVPPDLTFSEEFVLHGTRRRARILSFGGGHSPSDVLVDLPDDGIVFLGDLLAIGFHPCLWDGEPGTLLEILARVRGLGSDRALPGHGPMGGTSEIRQMEEYVACLQRLAREGAEAGAAPASEAVPPEPFDGWKFGSFFPLNLAHVAARSSASPAP